MNKGPPETRIQRMVRRAEEIAADPTHGYSQKPPSGRWGPDYDCSSLIYYLADYAGYPVGTGRDKVRFTGTMLKDFEKAGFQILPFANVGISDLKIGDILLNLALHAEIYVGEGQSIGALSSETGGYVGESGDQTDQEIEKHPVITFDKGWDYVLRPQEDEEYEEIEEEGEEEMPNNYGGMNQPWGTPQQPWGTNNMGYLQGNNMQGYGMNNRGMNPQGQGGMQGYGNQGYPQGNLGQMNGYSQANAGYGQPMGMPNYGYPQAGGQGGQQGYQQYQQGGNQQGFAQGGGQQGGPQGMGEDLCFVMGIEGAKNLMGAPGTRKAVFDEDKALMYIVSFGQQGAVDNINVYEFNECSEEMPQHLSPLMHMKGQNSGGQMSTGEYITRAEFDELKEMMSNAKSTKPTNGSRNGNQQSGSKLNARTN